MKSPRNITRQFDIWQVQNPVPGLSIAAQSIFEIIALPVTIQAVSSLIHDDIAVSRGPNGENMTEARGRELPPKTIRRIRKRIRASVAENEIPVYLRGRFRLNY